MQYGQLFWGVLSTFAAFLVGLLWRRLSWVLMHLRARRFWRPLVSHDSTVVVGSFRDLPGFEASGVIGMGDNIALQELQRYFAGIGFKRFTVHYSAHLEWAAADQQSPLQGNLILLGGPDANQVTRLVLERIPLGIEFLEVRQEHLGRPPVAPPMKRFARSVRSRPLRKISPVAPWRVPVILDKESGRVHAPVLDHGELRIDCGVIVRCPNPFNARREVVILCGSYGYGTWAAVRYVQTKAFFSSVPKGTRALECVLAVEVVSKTPQGSRVEILRVVKDPAPLTSAVVVPRIID